MTIDLTNELSKRFIGQYSSGLDDKSRIIIPAPVRRLIEARAPVNPTSLWVAFDHRNGYDYLACFDSVRFGEIYLNIPGGNVENCRIDKQGRIRLSERFVSRCNLERKVESSSIIIAASPSMTHFEIWNKEAFEKGYHVDQVVKLYEL